ncbi:MAG TPA: hypothetical protein VFF73_15590 [Planctomycetota bacterium]|nr:hypothetical protein [Planctomycetota bacterium]
MHEALAHLKKRTEAAKKELDELAKLVSTQSEREQKALESFEYGNDFDAQRALPQERVVEALQEALEGVEEARDGLIRAVSAFKELR